MSRYARVIPPVEKPSALQLAIREWQRQLVARQNEQRVVGGSATHCRNRWGEGQSRSCSNGG